MSLLMWRLWATHHLSHQKLVLLLRIHDASILLD